MSTTMIDRRRVRKAGAAACLTLAAGGALAAAAVPAQPRPAPVPRLADEATTRSRDKATILRDSEVLMDEASAVWGPLWINHTFTWLMDHPGVLATADDLDADALRRWCWEDAPQAVRDEVMSRVRARRAGRVDRYYGHPLE